MTRTPSYKLLKCLVPKYLSSIELNLMNLLRKFIAFAEGIVHQNSNLSMGSLHVNSLFTDIILKETINIWTNLLYNNVNNVDVIKDVEKSESENPLSLSN